MNRRVAGVGAAVAAALVAPAVWAQPSLCANDEVTEWSCSAKGKVYSLCATRDLGPATGYLRYRAGTRSKPELVFPDPPRHPKGVFRLRLGSRGASLSFTNGGYEYWIYEPLAGATTIEVLKDGAAIGRVSCAWSSDTLTLTDTQQRFERLGVYR